jgi:hypothetical protein
VRAERISEAQRFASKLIVEKGSAAEVGASESLRERRGG